MTTDDTTPSSSEPIKTKFPSWQQVLEREGPPRSKPLPQAPEAPQAQCKVLHLPVWPDVTRAVPNGLLRSALFGVVGLGERRYMKGETLASVDGVEISYTGEQLDQSDADVWQAVLHMCRHQAMGEHCSFTAYELLKLLGRTNSGGPRGNRKVLDVQIDRLHCCTVKIKVSGRYSYAGHLIHHVERDEVSKKYVMSLNPKLLPLFQRDQYTLLDWIVRRQLAGKPLAQWLHGFYASHAEPHALRVDTLRELCGSEIARTRDFKVKLAKALAALAEVLSARGQPFSFAFEGDLVHVVRTASPAQQRRKKGRKKSD